MAAAAEQFVNRQAEELALQIPQRCLDPREHRRAEADPPPVGAALVHPPPQRVDVAWVGAQQDRPVELDDRRHDLRAEVAGVGLADTAVRPVGMDRDQGGAAQAARFEKVRIGGIGAGQQNGLDVGNLHDQL